VVAADLFLRGNVKAPTLGGSVTVKNAVWSRPFDTPGSIFDSSRKASSNGGGGAGGSAAPAATVPLKYDIHIIVPSALHVDNNLIRQLVASADLQLVGTYDRPVLSGHADVERGELIFEGRRYRLTRGTIGFYNPTRIDPFFDIQAETTVRVPGQTYRVTVSAAGTSDRMVPTFESDPPLPPVDVLALLFSEARHDINSAGSTASNAELRAMQNPNQRQTDILAARATQAFTSSLSGGVGKVVEQTFGVDTFQLTPSFLDPYNQQSPRVNPSARVTIGKRISDRAYLTFSRSLNTTVYDQIILLEYDASDRLSWILSRNEDQSYALEFRVRHVF
jgi:autotransporter translocation and assembly factor TamB